MARINTKMKRKYDLSTRLRHTNYFKGNKKPKKGDRTFKSMEGAKKWATETLKLKEGTYNIVPAKRNIKFKIELIEKPKKTKK